MYISGIKMPNMTSFVLIEYNSKQLLRMYSKNFDSSINNDEKEFDRFSNFYVQYLLQQTDKVIPLDSTKNKLELFSTPLSVTFVTQSRYNNSRAPTSYETIHYFRKCDHTSIFLP